jgi:alpha-galactosidase
MYRQDLNIDPLRFWRSADAPDRQGITEIHHIEGLYQFWDDLLRRHPGLAIDNNSSGNRRCDLETASRSVNLWRTDLAFDPEVTQSQHMGIGRYMPWGGTGCQTSDRYTFRSNIAAGLALSLNGDNNLFASPQVEELRKRIEEYKLLRPLFYGDFYPLTSYSTATDTWCVYQLERKDLNLGAILAFRRKESPFPEGRFKLRGLSPHKKYEVKNYDTGICNTLTGEELMNQGLLINISNSPGSALFIYNEKK